MSKWLMMSSVVLFSLVAIANEHHHREEESIEETMLLKTLIHYLGSFSKVQQANIGAFIISSASVPIFVIILMFRIENKKVLDVMSAFAAGALIGDVFIHNMPEIFHSNKHGHKHKEGHLGLSEVVLKKELFMCWGVLFLFIMEKIMGYYSQVPVVYDKATSQEKENEHHHGHQHHAHTVQSKTNIIMSLFGDFLHNVTDGLGIGAGFNKSPKIGISLTLSIFFHEIPHEIGDFSYLLKQNMSITNALLSQFLSAFGAFLGVYISNLFGENSSNHVISFASGAFLYLGINTIMGDLKKSDSLLGIILHCAAFVIGVLVLVIL